MIFSNPTLALAAAAAAAIPLLLHLFLRRPKATLWGSNYLLKIALAQIQRRRRIEKWLLLALRVLAILFVGLAAAGPFAKAWIQDATAQQRWIIIDDGATSAEIRPGNLSQLDDIKKKIISSVGNNRDQLAIVLASVPARIFLEPTTNRDAFIQAITSVQSQQVPSDIASALEKALPSNETKQGLRQIEVWSGFRRGSIDLEKPLNINIENKAEQIALFVSEPLQGQPKNQTISKCNITRIAGETEEAGQRMVRVEIQRNGELQQETNQLRIQNNSNETIAKGDVSWNDNATEREFELRVQLGKNITGGLLAEIQDDAQPFDNKRFIALTQAQSQQVTILGRKSIDANMENLPASSWILRALESTGMVTQEIDAETISIRPPHTTDTIILTRPDLVDQAGWSWLQNFSKGGGVLIITPSAQTEQQSWAVDIERLLDVPIRSQKDILLGEFRLATKQPRGGLLMLLGAELDALCEPVHISKYLPLETTDAAATTTLTLSNGKPLMCWAKPKNGSGVVAILGVSPDLSWSDLPVKPLMVPLFQELVRGGRVIAADQQEIESGSIASLGLAAAGGVLIPPNQSAAGAIEINENGQSKKQILIPGLWTLQKKNGQKINLAVNLNPAAACIQPLLQSAVGSWFQAFHSTQFLDEAIVKKPAAAWTPQDTGTSCALFILALFCGLVESILSKKGSPRPIQKNILEVTA